MSTASERALVDALHAAAERCAGRLAALLVEAAVTLDEYRAGLRQAAPNHRAPEAPDYPLCHDTPEAP